MRPFLLSRLAASFFPYGLRKAAHTFSCILFGFAFYSLSCVNMSKISSAAFPLRMVENNGFEPLTPCLQSRCSSQLS